MPSTETRQQIDKLALTPQQPLIICDVDEVIVHFIKGLERFLARHDLWLDPASFALNGNIKTIADNKPVVTEQVRSLLATFFQQDTKTLQPIKGSVSALQSLAQTAEIVFLSNLPHEAYDDRLENLRHHGMDFPLISNSGLKGPAVARLTARHQAPVFFIDDIGHYLTSVFEHCPEVHLIHFMQDERFARHAKKLPVEHFRTDNWQDVETHIRSRLDIELS